MKATLFDSQGKKKSEIQLPKLFSQRVRPDVVSKYFEVEKFIQPYASNVDAGKRQSASGTISHKRHDWKGHYGRGISRVPRKTMWRRGTRFFWIAANAPGTRQGRRAHPPKGIGKEKKLNKKEIQLAFNSAFAATAQSDFIISRYATLDKIENMPAVIESLPEKTKSLTSIIKNIFGKHSNIAFKKKSVRAGKGKLRGRKYKSNAGALILIASDEKTKFKTHDIKSVSDVSISDLYPLGRLTIYTKKAMEELSREKSKETKHKNKEKVSKETDKVSSEQNSKGKVGKETDKVSSEQNSKGKVGKETSKYNSKGKVGKETDKVSLQENKK